MSEGKSGVANWLCRVIGHDWTFPVPKGGSLHRTCRRCHRVQKYTVTGVWKWTDD